MGIRFTCPNGHRLNVKSYLAGKRGICPHCGIRFDIPLESWPDLENRDKTSNAAEEAQTTNPVPPGEYASPALPAGTHSTSTTRQPPESTVGDMTANQLRTHQMPPTAVDVSPAEPFDAKLPINNPTKSGLASTTNSANSLMAGAQEWFVQTTDGNRYGPADDQTMHEWIAEGRVAPDNLVHQRGWPTWKSADTVFAELRQEDANEAGVEPDLVVDASPRARHSRGQKTKPRLVAIIATLGITSVVLLGALIYVINRS